MGHFSWGEVRVSTVWVERVLEACAHSSQTKSGRSSAPARLAERGAAGHSAHSPPGQARSELEMMGAGPRLPAVEEGPGPGVPARWFLDQLPWSLMTSQCCLICQFQREQVIRVQGA